MIYDAVLDAVGFHIVRAKAPGHDVRAVVEGIGRDVHDTVREENHYAGNAAERLGADPLEPIGKGDFFDRLIIHERFFLDLLKILRQFDPGACLRAEHRHEQQYQ